MGRNIYKHLCCLCKSHNPWINICIQDNYQSLKQLSEFKHIFKKYNLYSILRICETCSMKLRMLIKCDTTDFSYDFQKSMQDSPHFEDTNCQCEHCKAKFGNLPLLASVIEKYETYPSPQFIEKTEQLKTDSYLEQIEAPLDYSIKEKPEETIFKVPSEEPSTSKETVHRKIMTCEHCGKTFTHKGDMNKHLRIHTGEQPYSCPICSRKFAHTSNLARHLKVHSGDKPFHCERCNKSFSRKDKLIMHQKTKLCLNAGHSSKS